MDDFDDPVRAGSEERLRAAVGRNADFYLSRWADMHARSSHRSWNWAACLVNLYWMAWRRMWVHFAWVAAAFIGLAAIGTLWPDLAMPTFLLSIAITFVTGAFGNHLYHRQIAREVDSASGLEREAALARLRRRGGTSWAGLLLALGATLALMAWSVSSQMATLQAEPEAAAHMFQPPERSA